MAAKTPGVRRRHSRQCPAHPDNGGGVVDCRCPYQVQAGPRGSRQTKTFATQAAARSWKRDVERAYERGERVAGRAPRLREAAERWLAAAEGGIVLARGDRRYKPSTLRGYRRCMEAELYPELGDQRLDQITRGRLNQFVQTLQARGLAAQTVKNVVIPLRALYRHAIDLEHVASNPTTGLRVPAGSGRRLRFATPAEIPGLLAALDERDRPLWATAIYAGLRRGELMALRWADVDLAGGIITVRFSYDPGVKRMVEVKSAAGQDRRIAVCAALREHLLAHRQRAGGRPRGLVFARRSLAGAVRGHHGPPDGPFSDQAVGERARRAWDTAGVRHVSLHDCRHTFASLMIAATAAAGSFNPKAIQTALGHASIVQTYDRYGHLFPGAEEETGRMLDRFLDAPTQGPEAALRGVVGEVGELLDESGDGAVPEVLQLVELAESWLAGRAAVPSVPLTVHERHERAARVPRTAAGGGR